jgi:catechol 2,3-dioxygenase-like lactoylglutathione lyase family enzyme
VLQTDAEPRIEHMTLQRMDHVGIVVDDFAAATEFFVELGLVLRGETPVEGRWVDRIVGLEGVRADTESVADFRRFVASERYSHGSDPRLDCERACSPSGC